MPTTSRNKLTIEIRNLEKHQEDLHVAIAKGYRIRTYETVEGEQVAEWARAKGLEVEIISCKELERRKTFNNLSSMIHNLFAKIMLDFQSNGRKFDEAESFEISDGYNEEFLKLYVFKPEIVSIAMIKDIRKILSGRDYQYFVVLQVIDDHLSYGETILGMRIYRDTVEVDINTMYKSNRIMALILEQIGMLAELTSPN